MILIVLACIGAFVLLAVLVTVFILVGCALWDVWEDWNEGP